MEGIHIKTIETNKSQFKLFLFIYFIQEATDYLRCQKKL